MTLDVGLFARLPGGSHGPAEDAVQIALPMAPVPLMRLEQLEIGRGNPELFAQLAATAESGNGEQILFWGRPGSGRTSILRALCNHFFARGWSAALIDCGSGASALADSLAALRTVPLVCLDDLQCLESDPGAQEVILDYWQRRAGEDRPCSLLLASTAPPDRLQLLPDVAGRLAAGAVYHLMPLEDRQCVSALMRRAAEEAVVLPQRVAEYLVERSPGNLAAAMGVLERLLELSSAERQAVTVPLARRVLPRL